MYRSGNHVASPGMMASQVREIMHYSTFADPQLGHIPVNPTVACSKSLSKPRQLRDKRCNIGSISQCHQERIFVRKPEGNIHVTTTDFNNMRLPRSSYT